LYAGVLGFQGTDRACMRGTQSSEYRHSPICLVHFLKKYSINAYTHTHRSTHPYKHIHAHHTPISTFERLSRLNLDIHEVGYQERLIVDWNVASH
jgi:hypothetical protein